MTRVYAVSTRLEMRGALKGYLEEYIGFYSAIQRRVFYDLCHGLPKEMGMSKYITYICNTYGVLKRTANSIRYEMQGRIKAYLEMRRVELAQLGIKIRSVRSRIGVLVGLVSGWKPMAASNQLDKRQLCRYRRARASLYYQRNRLNRLVQREGELSKRVKDGRVSLCFGTKRLYGAQNRLMGNGYKTHGEWRRAFRRGRDKGIFYLGSGDETCGNQILQLKPSGDGFEVRLRKDKPYEADRKYVTTMVKFKYMGKEISEALSCGHPMTYRVSRRGRGWYLTVVFSKDTEVVTCSAGGVIGIDYNVGFMEVVGTDGCGNMVSASRVELPWHGSGSRSGAELKACLSGVVRYACGVGKDIVVEGLDFGVRKAGQIKGRGRGYNRMLHLFDYHRYLFWLGNLCAKYGVGLIRVNPAYTSRIGYQKYSRCRKLTVHRAAAYVIARRGQGYGDRLTVQV